MLPAEFASLDYVAVPVQALDVHEDGCLLYCGANTVALSYLGISLGDIIGKTAVDIYPAPYSELATLNQINVIKTRARQTYESDIFLADSVRTIRTTLTPVLGQDGNVKKIVETYLDITIEQQVLEAQKTVQTITSEVEDFVSMAAHDLRTPMRNVSHIAEMLREEFQDMGDGKTELIDLLEEVALKATGLISDVLAHAQATRIQGHEVPFDLKDLCEDLHTVLDPHRAHSVICRGEKSFGNKAAFQIVLRNLLDNAFKHGGKNHLTLNITASPAPKGMIEISVRDDGCGLDNPGIAFLNSGKLRVDSGFGLLGIRRLVRASGGDIFAEVPEDGTGTLIRFTLPGELLSDAESPQNIAISAR